MKKYILIFSLQLLTFGAFAQIDDLLNNKNITWIAEGYQDVATEQSMNHKFGDTLSDVVLQKYIKQTAGNEPAESFAPYLLMNAIEAQKMAIYEDAACKKQLPQKLWGSIDTISIFDPNTFEQKTKIVKANVDYKSVAFFRMYKVFYYDAAATKFGARVISIAPMQKEMNGKNTSYKPMCWVKVHNVSSPESVSNQSIAWAAQISLDDSPFFVGNRKNVKILKEADALPLKTYYETLKSKTQIPLFAPQQHGFGSKWSSSERKLSLLDEIRDTISVFDPVTYVETIKYATTKVVFESLKLVEHWSWNTNKNEFEIAVVATAPLLATKDEKGRTLFTSPYFYRLQNTDL
jgi:hypothetical protein